MWESGKSELLLNLGCTMSKGALLVSQFWKEPSGKRTFSEAYLSMKSLP